MKASDRIGLLAGGGELPVIFGDAARKNGTKVVAFAAKGITSPSLGSHVDKIYWFDAVETGKLTFILLSERLKNFVMLGKIPKTIFFKKDFSRSKEITSILNGAKNQLDDNLMRKIADIGKKFGIAFISPAEILSELIPRKGTLTEREPTQKEKEDIEFGRKIASSVGSLGIGQAVVIKNKDVIAVEAVEGTDETIKRAGELAGNGTVCVKIVKPNQDLRFDIPAVGIETVNSLIKAKASVLAIEAGKTFFINQKEAIALADRSGIAIVAI